jgi:cytochrome P450
LGDGLLMSDGARHVAQRRLIQPAFAPALYGAYLTRLEEAMRTVLATWSSGSRGSSGPS